MARLLLSSSIATISFAALLGLARPAGSGPSIDEILGPREWMATQPCGVAAVTVIAVEDSGATYGAPPRVRLEVRQVLRGKYRGKRIDALWTPPHHDIDYIGGDSRERIRHWQATPMGGPAVGERLIVAGHSCLEAKGWEVSAYARYADTEENRSWILRAIAEGDAASYRRHVAD